jgi:hypothetical protein
MIPVVLDANVVLAAIGWGGTARLAEDCEPYLTGDLPPIGAISRRRGAKRRLRN